MNRNNTIGFNVVWQLNSFGNLTKDRSENIDITWTAYGKIASINKSGVITKFAYDAAGNRILKVAIRLYRVCTGWKWKRA